MDLVEYKSKIQKISFILENCKCPEDILNSKVIDLKEDLQYLCLNSMTNYSILIDVIARLAQNGNKELVEDNIKNIALSMWNDLIVKNQSVKGLFIKNYDLIIENTGIVTYRDVENIVKDNETITLVYKSLPVIIRKLCTYDRATLIGNIKCMEDGISNIKSNLNVFFEKGEYDISTTYSKILVEMDKIPEISKIEILEACVDKLSDMLKRETAIDNETNNLLDWIYDAIEETVMENKKRTEFQQFIDTAIMENFEGILDKSNYDKTTIKSLKQFKCTHEKFEGDKNLFIDKSNKLIHTTKIYDLNYEKETKNKELEQIIDNSENIVRLVDKVDKKDELVLYDKISEEDKCSTLDVENSSNSNIEEPLSTCVVEQKIQINDEIMVPREKSAFAKIWNKLKLIFSKTF